MIHSETTALGKNFKEKDQVPKEIIFEIFQFLDSKTEQRTLLSLTQVNSESREYLSNDELWRPVLYSTFPASKTKITNFFRLVFFEASFNKQKYLDKLKKPDEYFEKVRISVIGSVASGKSALTKKFINGWFEMAYNPTLEDFYRKDMKRNYLLDILDTASQENYTTKRIAFTKSCNAFLLCIDMTNKTSLDSVEEILKGIKQHCNEIARIILVCTKCDLKDKIEIKKEEIKILSERTGYSFFFISSQNIDNVNEVFYKAVEEFLSLKFFDLIQDEFIKNYGKFKTGGKTVQGCTIF
eukprot:gene2697-3893_t